MAKFQAMMDMLSLVVPWIERDEKGQIVRDQSIPFNQGTRSGKLLIPASLSTEEPNLLKYLRSYGGNEKNGGTSFRELVEKKSEVKTEKPAPEQKAAAVVTELPALSEEAPVSEEEIAPANDLAETPSTGKTDYPEANTVQEASAVLRGLFPDLTTRDTGSKAKIKAFIADKNITFSNLEL